ncbi:rifin [Plasmodium falciparum Dd2]|uniref:Rifin n=1 Tax=Plasmodium falciparum (isolate Dd2) TaxID=57267 RepID=A0A0L7M8P3_PLAF4|nr:rifin [Plasmodium falciparum Dd2]
MDPVNNQMNHYNTVHMKNTEPIKSYRSLCECELYTSMYDDDPEMKEIMHDFDRQTSQRFEEYNERMNKKRQKCKEQCDRDIKNIILKDKIAKELKQQLATLETDISTDDIPTCVCEKSVADKMEKTCLICGKNLGVAVPGLGVLCAYGVNSMVQAAIDAGIDFATQEGLKEGTQAGIQAAIKGVISKFSLETLGGEALEVVITSKTYNQPMFLIEKIMEEYSIMCESTIDHQDSLLCLYPSLSKSGNHTILIATNANDVARNAIKEATNETFRVTSTLTAEKTTEATSTSVIFSNPIVISFIVIVVLLIILLIIYLILRYRRKRKMKKKLQYIKLLKE